MHEVEQAIKKTANGKACRPDNVYNEHLKAVLPKMRDVWTAIMNGCLEKGSVPERWRTAVVKMLYKGTGDPCDSNAYRGTLFKILTRILTDRLTKVIESHIPEQQFGFCRGQAVRCLQEDREEALRVPGGKLHVVFIGFTKALDTLNR